MFALSRTVRLLRVVVPCFLAQNLAFGLSQGSFGPLLPVNANHFAVSQTSMVFAISAFNLALAAMSPLVSSFMIRNSVRQLMIGALLLSACANYGLSVSTFFPVALAMYFLLGMGCAVLGVLGPLSLINTWLPEIRGRILGYVNAPIVLLAVPFLIGNFLEVVGRDTFFLLFSAAFLIAVPVFFAIPNDPKRIGVQAMQPDPGKAEATRAILANRTFWAVALAIGVMAGTSSAFIVQVAPFGIARDMSFEAAASLVSIFAASGIFGSIVLGWLCDRMGGVKTIALSAFLQAMVCLGLVLSGVSLIIPLVSLMGVLSVPIVTLMGATISEIMEKDLVNRSVGIIYLIKLPFIFSFAPLFGFISDLGGGFSSSFIFLSVTLVMSSVLLVKVCMTTRPVAA